MQKPVAPQAKIDERRLDRRLDVGDSALVDIADVRSGAGPLHVKLLELVRPPGGRFGIPRLRRR